MPLERLAPAVRKHFESRRTSTANPDAALRVAEQAADIMLVVAGGGGIKAAYLPTWGGTTQAVSRAIRVNR